MEDKIKFYEIANILDLDLEYDGDETDLRLHGREKLNWGAETAAEYEEATNAIDAISYKGNGWEVYATYDVSGFDYWMLQQEEPNYINMTIMFDNDNVDVTEIPAIKNAMDMAYSDAYSISEKYDYAPNSEYKRGGKVDGRSTRDKSTWNSGAAWTRDRNAYNKSENWEKPMNKRKYAEGGGVSETLTGLAWYMTFDSAGSDYDDIYNNTQSQEEFDNYVEEGKILAVFPFVIEVENQFQIIRKIAEYVGNEDEGTTILGYRLDEDKNGGFSDNLPYNDDEYKRGGKVDGRSTRAKDTWNRGSAWTRDRNAHNKSEDWEKPMNKRKYAEGGGVDTYYRVFDTQRGVYFATGYNATSMVELIEDFQSYILGASEIDFEHEQGTAEYEQELTDFLGTWDLIAEHLQGVELEESSTPFEDEWDEYKRGGKVDGRSTRDKSTWNSGAAWTRDRNAYNKSENWEKPLNQRGKSVAKSSSSASAKSSSSSSSSASSKGKSKKYMYIPNYMIRGAEVNNSGKTTDIDGANILDGIYVKAGTKYAEGGGIGEKYGDYGKDFTNSVPIINLEVGKKYKNPHGGDVVTIKKIDTSGEYSKYPIAITSDNSIIASNYLLKLDNEKYDKFAEGGGVPDLDKKMALINLDMIHEYSVKLDNIVTEETELEEWVKMKLTRIEQNVADVKHALAGGEKFDKGGMIFKKQLLHISKYAKDLIDMLQSGSNLMGWQENKLAIAADNIDGIYHYMDYLEHKKSSDDYLPFAKGGGVGYSDIKKLKEKMTDDLLKKCGVFFAFSNEQFNENKTPLKDGEKYISIGGGGYMPKGKLKDFQEGMKSINKIGRKKIEENNLAESEILYELKNHECFYTGDYSDVVDMFEGTYTEKQIRDVYNKNRKANQNFKRGGVPRNVGRDWLFKSKQDWEQDYDRKREYKEYKKEGWLANWFKEGGEAEEFDFEEFRKRQAIISEAVKFAFVRAIGFDNAFSLLKNEELSISPYRLVERAVSGEFIGVHEINKDVVESAIDEATEVTRRYKDSGQGIGSSDMTAFLKNFLDSAGFKTAFISSRLERIDENGNAIKVKSDLPNTTMFKEGGEIIEDIRQGDYVNFGSYGVFYVCNPSYSETSFWVTKEEEDRYDSDAVGYSMPKWSAIKIIETGDDEYAKGGRVKNYKYVPNYMIESVDVERNGKTTEIDGGNILDGLYVKNTKFEEGGYVENIPTETLESMIGRKLNGWNDDVVIYNGVAYKKCFMKPYYKIA
jgi:hypothetical protein